MTLLLHAVIGAALAGFGWLVLQPVYRSPALVRLDEQGAGIPTASGVVIVLAVLAVAAFGALGTAAGTGDPVADASRDLMVRAALGFGFLGLFDDLVGTGSEGGLSGHLAALRQGRLTTGFVRLAGGVLAAVVAVAPLEADSLGWLLVDAGVVVLAANLAQLLNRAPGRAIKVTLAGFVALVAVEGATAALAGPAVAVGGGAAMLAPDLREHATLGATGAGVLGAAVGLGAVITVGHGAATVVLAVLLVLNAASEWVSFSAVIDRTAPLRWLDRLGSRRAA